MTIQDFIRETRKAGGVINTSVVVAMAMGIITSKDPTLFHENGGHLVVVLSTSLLLCFYHKNSHYSFPLIVSDEEAFVVLISCEKYFKRAIFHSNNHVVTIQTPPRNYLHSPTQ